MEEILKAIAGMAPEEALSQITSVQERLLADLDEEKRSSFLMNLVEHSGGDKVSGMVHL
jgi:hypothetical protein